MAKASREQTLQAIESIVRRHPDGIAARDILAALSEAMSPRMLQYHLKDLIERERLIMDGSRRGARYRFASAPDEAEVSLSEAGQAVIRYVRQALVARKPVGYDRSFLDGYRPNVSAYLTAAERARLAAIGRPLAAEQPAGTYARQILDRLLIDLSWNSSRLEGNTYSLLDTRRLIELGEGAEGHAQLEAQMILNHKDAIEFLVGDVEEIGFNRYTILNLHALLANNLLTNPSATGRLRHIRVGIESSVFLPLEVPQLIAEEFDQLLATAEAIADPFEQAFFVMVYLPYLQPFDDVNKRVSRLAANIPLIKGNLAPLSFTDVPRQTYIEAMLGVYELRQVDLLKDLFFWAYERSASRYVAVRQALGEPDPFRLRYRAELREAVAAVIRARGDRKAAAVQLAEWATRIREADRQRFIAVAETELHALHEGNFARYQIRPAEFDAWHESWNSK